VEVGSLHAVLLEMGSRDPVHALRSLNWSKVTSSALGATLLIELPWSLSSERAERYACEASELCETSFLIRAQTNVDVYAISEYTAGQCVRRIAYDGDAEERWELQGEPRRWEADLLFALPREEFVGYLSDDDTYTDEDLELAERAHGARDLGLMSRRPPLLAVSLWEWLRSKRVDPASPNART
jgi:hypothetical protein